jgi:hypothetical protein
MPFIGNKPSAVPLTSADITDGIIVNADINASAAIALTKLASTGTLTVDNIQFPATQVASANANNLDDYEEGTFTAAFTSTGASFSYTFQNGFYTKIGRSVHCLVIVRAQSSGTLSNQLFITGFPFTSANTSGNFASVTFGQFFNVDYPTSSNFINGIIEPNESKIALQTSNDDSGTTILTAASIDGATSSGFILSINYIV